jgi:uncharacterized protein (TIGR00255 family)
VIVSMTGFGAATLSAGAVEATVSVRSLNHRYLELGVHLPRRFSGLEPELRRLVQARVQRGKLELAVQARGAAGDAQGVRAADAVIASFVSELRRVGAANGVPGPVSLGDIVRCPGAFEAAEAPPEPASDLGGRILELAESALDQLAAMRRAEGGNLAAGLAASLDAIQSAAARIAGVSEAGKAQRQKALAERVKELAAGLALDEGRLHQEVVRLVERSEVAEELERLASHVAQMREAMAGPASCGKRLDFLTQELMREANTIGSKAATAQLVHEVVGLKAEVERFREQVQNVE